MCVGVCVWVCARGVRNSLPRSDPSVSSPARRPTRRLSSFRDRQAIDTLPWIPLLDSSRAATCGVHDAGAIVSQEQKNRIEGEKGGRGGGQGGGGSL